jgi:chromate transporter
VAAGAVGLILATTLQLGRRSLSRVADVVFVVITVVCVNRLHLRVPVALIAVGALAIVWYAFVDAPDARSRR